MREWTYDGLSYDQREIIANNLDTWGHKLTLRNLTNKIYNTFNAQNENYFHYIPLALDQEMNVTISNANYVPSGIIFKL